MDWDGIWRKWVDSSSYSKWMKKDGPDYWAKRARDYNRHAMNSPWVDEWVSRMAVGKDSTVLDVGAGTGRWSVPLAKKAGSVTAVDPSEAMLECLEENARSAGVDNIRVINSPWEDVDPTALGRFDVVIASHSLTMRNIRDALAKMDGCSSGRVYIFTFASRKNWFHEIWPRLHGEQHRGGPRYLIFLGILQSMGIHPNMEITPFTMDKEFHSFDEAFTYSRRFVGLSDDDGKAEVLRGLVEELQDERGRYRVFDRGHRAAIWWQSEA